ncbi:Spo0B domain-containing protein [Sporosarcina sp. GW1-11]|uniref:Spo0B domain-containing protein n=1 Tax=Sporosarcina sp. GW1-11 TaxID=2899126 RepID=UPI00294CFD08|nr:Spo0B domain-containing protein [Sporosarcina sp. GW1-11]MDV6377210.1 Spo0B domain-containing protein [Sporosarcina sp. GW1-11]
MGKNELNVSQAVKFSRHDHMNDLQLLLMYIDMGKYTEAKNCILEKTADMQRQALLQKLCLPYTEEWLTTLEWRYPVLTVELYCDIVSKIDSSDLDVVLVNYLENLVQMVIPKIERYANCAVTIEVVTEETSWFIQLTFSEVCIKQLDIPENSSQFTVEVHGESNQWTITIGGQLGGK